MIHEHSPSECDSVDFDSVDFDLDLLDTSLLDEIIDIYPLHESDQENRETRTTGLQRNKRKTKKAHKSPKLQKMAKLAQLNTETEVDLSEVMTVTVPETLYEQYLFRFTVPRPRASLTDSIFYFPHAMVNCLNSGDNLGLSDLIMSHMSLDCVLGIYCFSSPLSPRAFLKFFELLNVIHPDRILHLNDTAVVNNQIDSTGVMKFTDCKMLFDGVKKTVNEPMLMSMFDSRATHLKNRLYNSDQSEEERKKMLQLVESDLDLVVYGCIHFHLTLDETTNKATGLYLSGGLTSAHTVQIEY